MSTNNDNNNDKSNDSKVILKVAVAEEEQPSTSGGDHCWSSGMSPQAIVKGGTTSYAYDQMIRAKEADANRRRDYQDNVRKMIEDDVDAGLGVGGFHEKRMVTNESPKLLLKYLNADGTVYQECISEVIEDFDPFGGSVNMMFTLVCPDCAARGLPQSECQIMVRSEHRKWFLDERKRGVVPVETPWGVQVLHQAGTVTVQDIVKCSNFMCTWAANIDDSKVRRVSNRKGSKEGSK